MSKDISDYVELLNTVRGDTLQARIMQGLLRRQALQPVNDFIQSLHHQFVGAHTIIHAIRFPGSDFDHPVLVITPQDVHKSITVSCDHAESDTTPDGKPS